MRFTTASGAVYDIFEVEGVEVISRECEIPIVNVNDGSSMPTVAAQQVSYDQPPTAGERFHYFTPSHGFCVSTPVVDVEP